MKLYGAAGAHKQKIDAEEAVKIFKECTESRKFIDEPIARGMDADGDFYLLHGEAGKRISVNTNNIYTLILSEVLGKQGYPRRSASIICANNAGSQYVKNFGTSYVIIPFNGVKIGVCPDIDIYQTQISLDPDVDAVDINILNEMFDELFDHFRVRRMLSSATYENFIEKLKYIIGIDGFAEACEDAPDFEMFKNLTPQNVESVLAKAYSNAGFKLASTTSPHIFNDGVKREVWIGGRCLAVKREIYRDWLKDVDV